ncbi:activating signal cointegrator 1 complex subunit 2-like [Pollicipes pollicipes]|uniref:activating signal cointegrator 1 complex subunit 2-like n=1 Tax=Pollicipes pollicipes TaxID=41117 RepID=UPI001884C808|nr:activating signal cointegrator 1 complex subunit 2-like [Pollicipes pollicipes]
MTRDDVDLSCFHRGKRLTTARLARELADKSALRESGLRERYELFGSLSADGSVYEAAQYEDEYDDTYDGVSTGQEEPKEETEVDSGAPVPLNQALPSSRWRRRDQPDEDGEDETGPRRDQFVANPEEVRARQEARRQQQQQQRGRGGRRQGPPPERDVTGRPRGQGQDKQVLQNRRRKTENKSAQHRRGADRKQRGGMF